ncbi:MAG: CHASE3 domain-containing protein [Hymenobacteraceae bacterium]|nr:CHASE3 domain-containing protein [Hymenobacteraceae bacterium]MDX5481570.1 CHASE3 domain-containing protein [Hymenobacteraceae bacterium]
MKLVTKIYLAFGCILVVFSFLTVSYIIQSGKVERDVEQAMLSVEILRLAEGMEKAVVDAETGVRGFQVSDNETFLEPYYKGRETYDSLFAQISTLVQNKEQVARLQAIDNAQGQWLSVFAEPSVTLQRQALANPAQAAAYEDFRQNYIRKGVGKKLTDQIRQHFREFDAKENELKNTRLRTLASSMAFTDNLAIALTVVCIVAAFIVIQLLVKAVRGRLINISSMAREVAEGHFNARLTDNRQDEISQVSHSLNVMAQRLDDSFANLRKMNNELDQFAYVVSHDLKAPLRAINSLAEWIEEDLPDVDPEVKRNLQLMRGRVFRMENLINGILTYSRIGRKELPQSTFAVGKLIAEIGDSLAPSEEVSLNIATPLPEITTERVLLEQVFTNLIGNGIKYNDKPDPAVTIGCRELEGAFEFWVQDNGPGIPAEYHQKVFGVFQTMEARDTKESTGIGLAIVKKIVEEKGGNINLTSEAGKGCRFTFTWPAAETEQAKSGITSAQVA